MRIFDLNRLPEENEDDSSQVEDNPPEDKRDIGIRQVSTAESNLNELPKSEENILPNESIWNAVYFFTATYFPLALKFLK
ncbi:hypothetical protein OROMI_004143 [Orobanche minor]